MLIPEIKTRVRCPTCGHDQIVQLQWSVFSNEMAETNKVFNHVDTYAINGGFECICGKEVTAVLLVNAVPITKDKPYG